MQYALKYGGGRREEAALHPRFELGPDGVHPVHRAQEGGLVAVRPVAGDPEPDPHAVAAGKEALQVWVRPHHLVAGLHRRDELIERVNLPLYTEAGAPLHPGGLIDFPAEAERHVGVLPDLQPVEAHQAQQGEGVLRMIHHVAPTCVSLCSTGLPSLLRRRLGTSGQGLPACIRCTLPRRTCPRTVFRSCSSFFCSLSAAFLLS